MMNYWVSPSGKDNNPGTQELPFLTPQKARDAIRESRGSAPQTADMTVWFEDGIYRLKETFSLSSEDSGRDGFNIIYKAAEGATPRIYGSVAVTGWEIFDLAHDVYRAKITPGIASRQLYVNGARAKRACTTDFPEGFVPIYNPNGGSGQPDGICYQISDFNNPAWMDPSTWQQVDKVEAVLETQWKMMRLPVKSITGLTGNTGILNMQPIAWTNANLYLDKTTDKPGVWSFWRITRFENALAFLTDCGEWYLDEQAGYMYYKPLPGEDLLAGNVEVELPVLEVLLDGCGSATEPLMHIVFEGLTFSYATWLEPNGPNGYVADQSGFRVVGTGHTPNYTGHVKTVVKTPGNLRMKYAHHTCFRNNLLVHLGAVGLDYATGSRHNLITGNRFTDISSAAIQLGDVAAFDSPVQAADEILHNTITENQIRFAAVEYVDAAGIFAGFTAYTTISCNRISDVHWSGIAMGWGWGLLDPDGYPGIPNAEWFEWGHHNYHTVNRYNKILYNQIERFMLTSWDGGAIYTTGYQGTCREDALLIEGNIAMNKRPESGGNVFYTDGGSRWIIELKNTSINNPAGQSYFGPAPKDMKVFFTFRDVLIMLIEDLMAVVQQLFPYGGDIGGCRTYGDIEFIGNKGISPVFYDVCQYVHNGISYPVSLTFDLNGGDEGNQSYGGATYPPMNPVNSWHVPRVSLPGILGMQKDYISEWWYYAGVIHTSEQQSFSIIFNLVRMGMNVFQVGMSMAGIGWKEEGISCSLHATGAGIGVSQQGPHSLLNSLVVDPVSDICFQLDFRPEIELSSATHSFWHPGYHINLGGNKWNIAYTGGNILGAAHATYRASLSGTGYIARADAADTEKSSYQLQLSFTDNKGMVMENKGGVVGSSYECAMPLLQVQAGGELVIGKRTFSISGGSLWMDRQMLAGVLGGSNIPLNDGKDLLKWLFFNGSNFRSKLYTGNWMGITLNNGLSLVLVEFWTPHTRQWISGTLLNQAEANPQPGGFGNIYFTREASAGNGGQYLRPRLSLDQSAGEWDYDINILRPENGGLDSPHWTSPQTGITYCTAWQISFSPELKIAGLPEKICLFVLCENSEIVVSPGNGYFEGAAFIYGDPDASGEVIGQAFVEQMGYN